LIVGTKRPPPVRRETVQMFGSTAADADGLPIDQAGLGQPPETLANGGRRHAEVVAQHVNPRTRPPVQADEEITVGGGNGVAHAQMVRGPSF